MSHSFEEAYISVERITLVIAEETKQLVCLVTGQRARITHNEDWTWHHYWFNHTLPILCKYSICGATHSCRITVVRKRIYGYSCHVQSMRLSTNLKTSVTFFCKLASYTALVGQLLVFPTVVQDGGGHKTCKIRQIHSKEIKPPCLHFLSTIRPHD